MPNIISPVSRKHLLDFFARSLRSFTSSQDDFRVLCTLPHLHGNTTPSPRRATHHQPGHNLIILDSSFNPPTRAHAQMASSALEISGAGLSGTRLMLLLAVNNADKSVQPAALETRLAMMEGFARDLLKLYQGRSPTATSSQAEAGTTHPGGLEIDLAVTSMPFFHAKSRAILASGAYGDSEQVFLCGFDTVTRIFNPQYYNDDVETPAATVTAAMTPMQRALRPFFQVARLRVTVRPDDGWGTAEDQIRYVKGLESGGLEEVGGDGEWVERIELVQGVDGTVSSSKVRQLVRDGGHRQLGDLVGDEVMTWIEKEGMYGER